MDRHARISAAYQPKIQKAAETFGDHEGVNAARVLRWLSQFGYKDQPLACTVLDSIRYYTAANIRAGTRQLVQLVLGDLAALTQRKIIFVPVEKTVGGGASIIGRALRNIRETGQAKIQTFTDFQKIEPRDCEAVVFFDDFSGTGDTLVEWWSIVEPIVLPKDCTVCIALIAMTDAARPRIEAFADHVIAVDELDDTESIFSKDNPTFDAKGKETLLKCCRKTRCSDTYLRGYGECGLLLAFKHGCPNNSIPILWHDHGKWEALFRRFAL